MGGRGWGQRAAPMHGARGLKKSARGQEVAAGKWGLRWKISGGQGGITTVSIGPCLQPHPSLSPQISGGS